MSDESRMSREQAHIDALHVKENLKGIKADNPQAVKALEQAKKSSDPAERLQALLAEGELYQLSSDNINYMKQQMPKSFEQYRVVLAARAELNTALGENRAIKLQKSVGDEVRNQPEAYYNLSIEGRLGEAVGQVSKQVQWQDIPERLWGRVFEAGVGEVKVNQAIADRPDVKIRQ